MDWLYPVKAISTFGLVLISWVFFRAADLPQSMQILGQMFSHPEGTHFFSTGTWGWL